MLKYSDKERFIVFQDDHIRQLATALIGLCAVIVLAALWNRELMIAGMFLVMLSIALYVRETH